MLREAGDSSDDSGFEEFAAIGQKLRPDEDFVSERPPTTPPPRNFERPEQPVQPLTGFEHSLVPDMVFGWRPKLVHGGPIPLLFNKCELPIAIDPITDEEFPVIFHGFRPRDSMVMHHAFANKEGYPIPNLPAMDVYEFLHRRDQRLKDQRPFVGMNPSCSSSELVFDSTFESGNLDKVVKVGEHDYDLYMRADANTKGYHQWYHFSVKNGDAQEVRFNIVNFTKNESLYSQGMQPVVFSEKSSDKGWHRDGTDLKYRPSKLNALLTDRQKSYFSLTFSYRFENPSDTVYFAYAFPYTFSRLCSVLKELGGEGDRMKRETLCKSLSGVDVPVLTVTDFGSEGKKEHVIITARVHPGETHGSWMLEGLLRFLLSESPEAHTLREKLVFHIVPCLNPDGVILGNYRTGFAGNDLNRQFARPDLVLHPTVFAIKRLLEKVKCEGKILAFLDLHAHSRKKSVFIYGPYYPLHSEKYYTMRVLPKLICDQAPQFRYAACRFKNEASKQQAARLVIWKEMKLANSYTVEGSFYGYLTEDRKTVAFTEATILSVGSSIATGLHHYLSLLEVESRTLEEKRKLRRLKYFKPSPTTLSAGTQTLADVVNSIKAAETFIHEQDSYNDSEDDEDQLSPEDQSMLHDKIVAIMEEFSTLARPKSKRPGTKVATVRPKIPGRVTPEQVIGPRLEVERTVRRSGGFSGKRKPHVHVTPDSKGFCTLIPLPRMAEYRASRSVSTCRRKGKRDLLEISSREGNLSKYALETRRLIAKLRTGDSSEESTPPFLKPKSPLPGSKPSLSFTDDDTELIESTSLLISRKSPLARLSPTKKCNAPSIKAISVVAHIPLQKARLQSVLGRKMSTEGRKGEMSDYL